MGETPMRILPPATGPNGMNSSFPHTPFEAYIAWVRKNFIQLPSDGYVGTCLRGFGVRKNYSIRFSAQCNIVAFCATGCRNNNPPETPRNPISLQSAGCPRTY